MVKTSSAWFGDSWKKYWYWRLWYCGVFGSSISREIIKINFWIFQGKKIPKIHYIDELGQKLGVSDDTLEDIIDLTSDYLFARYPDMSDNVPFEQYNEIIAKSKIERAKRIFKALEDKYIEEINNDK